MNFQTILIIILFAFFGFSCSKITYLQVPLTLDESVGQQDVLVKTTQGKNLKFDYIIKDSDNYQGIKRNGIVPLSTESVEAVYLRLDKINNATISLNDNAKIKGFLLEVNDTSVVLAFSDRTIPHANYPITDIEKIRIRKNGSVRKGYLIGTGVAIGTGVILASVAIATGNINSPGLAIFATAGTFGILGSIVGLAAGSIAGKKKFKINGNMDDFNAHKMQLQVLSFGYYKSE